MTTFTEGAHSAEFILSEANGHRSRENGTVKSGENLAAGEVVMFDGTELVAYGAGSVTEGGIDEACGIMINAVDATDGALAGAYLARDAEVNLKLLTYPDGTDEEANTIASLKLLGIICRDEG